MGKRKRSGSSSRSSSSSSSATSKRSSSSSYSSSSSDKRRSKKSKKSKRSSRKSKKNKKKKKKSKKKSKKSKKKGKKKDASGKRSAVTFQYGQFGRLDPNIRSQKQAEFRAYLEEEKGVSFGDASSRDLQGLWEQFVEDFNTATLPHQKYYDIEAYYQKEKFLEEARAAKKMRKMRKKMGLDDPIPKQGAESEDEDMVFNDEEVLRREKAEERERKRLMELREEGRKAVALAQAKEALSMGRLGAVPKHDGGVDPALAHYLKERDPTNRFG